MKVTSLISVNLQINCRFTIQILIQLSGLDAVQVDR